MEYSEGHQYGESEHNKLHQITQMLDSLLTEYAQSIQTTTEHTEHPESLIPNQQAGINPYPLRTAMTREALISGTRTNDRLIAAQPEPQIIEKEDENPRIPIHLYLMHTLETQLLMQSELRLLAHALGQWHPTLDGKPATADIQVHFIHPTTSQSAERITSGEVINGTVDQQQNVQIIRDHLTTTVSPITTNIDQLLAAKSYSDTAQVVDSIKQHLATTNGIQCIIGNAPEVLFYEELLQVKPRKQVNVGVIESLDQIDTSKVWIDG